MACRTCGLVLDRKAYEDGTIEWQHPRGEHDDHPVDPAPRDSFPANFKCDFCLADHARWVLPVEQFMMAPGHESEKDWAACDDCAALLREVDWEGLTTRALREYKKRHGMAPPRAVLAGMYQQVRGHVTGTVRLRTSRS